ncbi:MAG TPA: hypothetical protein VMF53_12675 [Alphaproteobacteria bacterium]|nr:hypothetical protein [Alphaproteobacteria bacterium]
MQSLSQIGCVDRIEDLHFLKGTLVDQPSPFMAVLLYGRSGIGKSYLSNELTTWFPGHLAIKVRLSDQSNAALDGAAQRAVGEYLNDLAGKGEIPFPTFDRWFRKNPGNGFLNRLLEDVYEDLQVQLQHKIPGATSVLGWLTGTGKYAARHVFGASVEAGAVLSKQYAIEALANIPAFLSVFNAQTLDDVSCHFFEELLADHPGHKLIFEFTGEEPSGRLDWLKWLLEEKGVRTLAVPVKKIDFDEFAHSFASMAIDDDIIAHARERYEETNGNVRDMLYNVDYDLRLRKIGHSLPFVDVQAKGTRAALDLATDAERFVLAVIALHGGDIPKDRLEPILVASDLFAVTPVGRALDRLRSLGLIRIEDTRVACDHDDVSHQVLDWVKYGKFVLLAARRMTVFFEQSFDVGIPQDVTQMEALGRLIYLNSVTSDAEGLRSLLGELDRQCARFPRPAEARRALTPIKGILDGASAEQFLHLRAAYCATAYNCRLYDEALNTVEALPPDEPDVRLMKAATYNRLDRHDSALALCAAIAGDAAMPQRVKVRAVIVSIYAHRSRCDFPAALAAFHSWEAADIRDPVDKALFLRTAEVILRADLSLPYLRRAKALFEDSGDPLLKGFTCIDIGMQLGRLGRYETARIELHEAEDLLKAAPSQRFATANNLAVINLNEGICDDNTVALLSYTHETAPIEFDSIAAEVNLLIAHTLRREEATTIDYMTSIVHRIEAWATPDGSLLELLFHNLAWAARQFGHHEEADTFSQFQKRHNNANHTTWKANTFGPVPPEYTLPELPYRVCWLSPWHFPMRVTLRAQ